MKTLTKRSAMTETDERYTAMRKEMHTEASQNFKDDWEDTKWCLGYFASGRYSRLVLPIVGPAMIVSDLLVSGVGNGGRMIWASIYTRMAAYRERNMPGTGLADR